MTKKIIIAGIVSGIIMRSAVAQNTVLHAVEQQLQLFDDTFTTEDQMRFGVNSFSRLNCGEQLKIGRL
jgi:hypothetical protein